MLAPAAGLDLLGLRSRYLSLPGDIEASAEDNSECRIGVEAFFALDMPTPRSNTRAANLHVDSGSNVKMRMASVCFYKRMR